jgi:hypothetical protein
MRRYLRHRETLVQEAATCIQRIQKALTEMNLQLANVISDISGTTGSRILHAIVEGERDPQRLAAMRGWRIKATPDEVGKSLLGNWRDELIFVLGENLALYEVYQRKIERCDYRIERHLKSMSAQVDNNTNPLPKPRKGKRPRGNAPSFDLRSELYNSRSLFVRLAPDFFPALILLFAIVFVTTTVAGAGCKQLRALSTTLIFVTRL